MEGFIINEMKDMQRKLQDKTKIKPFTKNLYDDMPNGYQETINKGRCMSSGHAFSADRNGVEK